MRPIPKNLDYKVDEAYQDEPINLTNKTHLAPNVLNRYVTYMLLSYQGSFCEGVDLQEEFYEDFQDFTIKILVKVDRKALKPL